MRQRRAAPAAPKPRDDVRERRGERRAVRLARVRVEPVFVDPRVVRGRGRELRLRQREVRGEVRAIRRRLEMRVEIGHLLREVIGDAARGQRACVVARGGVLRAAGVLADDVGALVQRGELARGGRVRGLAVLAREAQTREAQVRLHGDALGGERGQAPGAGPAVEDQLAVTVAAGRRSHRARSSKPRKGCRQRMGDFAPTDLPTKRQFAVLFVCFRFDHASEKPKTPLGQVENLRQRARLTLTAPDPRTHAQTWLKTKKRLARPSSRQPPTKRSPRRTGASTRRTKISRPPDSRFPSLEASSSPPHLFP